MSAAKLSGRTRSDRFRELVELFIRAETSDRVELRTRPRFTKLSQVFGAVEVAEDGPVQASDLLTNLWAVNTRAEGLWDASGALDEAERDAAHDRRKMWAAVNYRKGRPPAEAYVVMPLLVFARLLGNEANR